MASEPPQLASAETLLAIATRSTPSACQCTLRRCGVWDSVSETDWPAAQMQRVATLRQSAGAVQIGEQSGLSNAEPGAEPTFEEFHPQGTRYDSPAAPIALNYFPVNRCEVHQCQQCQRHWLRYTEFGGYYVDHRVRELQAHLITDAP